MAKLYLGTSGWSYPEWRGIFYPEKLPVDQMLAFYASRFSAVEINNSFYRMPSTVVLAKWRETVPEGFRFAFKAPQEITHRRRLADAEQPTTRFAEIVRTMDGYQGPVLFQLPPYQRASVEKLDGFLRFARPLYDRVVFEFRHASWFTEETYAVLRTHDVALCLAESDTEQQPLVPAKEFAYLRLRKTDYSDDELRAWKQRLDALVSEGRDVYCFFKHEELGKGPDFVLRVMGSSG